MSGKRNRPMKCPVTTGLGGKNRDQNNAMHKMLSGRELTAQQTVCVSITQATSAHSKAAKIPKQFIISGTCLLFKNTFFGVYCTQQRIKTSKYCHKHLIRCFAMMYTVPYCIHWLHLFLLKASSSMIILDNS